MSIISKLEEKLKEEVCGKSGFQVKIGPVMGVNGKDTGNKMARITGECKGFPIDLNIYSGDVLVSNGAYTPPEITAQGKISPEEIVPYLRRKKMEEKEGYFINKSNPSDPVERLGIDRSEYDCC